MFQLVVTLQPLHTYTTSASPAVSHCTTRGRTGCCVVLQLYTVQSLIAKDSWWLIITHGSWLATFFFNHSRKAMKKRSKTNCTQIINAFMSDLLLKGHCSRDHFLVFSTSWQILCHSESKFPQTHCVGRYKIKNIDKKHIKCKEK